MENDYLIHRRQGRGTFVADHTSEKLAIRYTNIRTRSGMRLSGQVTTPIVKRRMANEMEQKRLGVRGHAHVKRIHR